MFIILSNAEVKIIERYPNSIYASFICIVFRWNCATAVKCIKTESNLDVEIRARGLVNDTAATFRKRKDFPNDVRSIYVYKIRAR